MGLAGVEAASGEPLAPQDDRADPYSGHTDSVGVDPTEPGPDHLDLTAQIAHRIAERRSVAGTGEVARSRRAHRSAPPPRPVRGPKHRGPDRGGPFRHVVAFAILTALLVFLLRTFVVASFYIPSGSMEPTLHGCPTCQPDLVMVDKVSYRFTSVSRGDVVVFDRPPLAPPEDKELIKRVVGLPGETVSGHDGAVYIGSEPLAEPYVNAVCDGTDDFAAITVPAGRYFMMGDNRCDSTDSRIFGTIGRPAMVGRAFAVVWPWKHLRWL